MSMTPAEFILSIDDIINDEVDIPVQELQQKLALDGLKGVVLKSPVGNPDLWKGPAPAGYVGGRFRANWNVGVGSKDLSTSVDIDKSGGSTISKGASEINNTEAYQIIWLTNNLPYASRLEDGWSTQAPGGMVALAFAELSSIK